jgi:hypothetical protein
MFQRLQQSGAKVKPEMRKKWGTDTLKWARITGERQKVIISFSKIAHSSAGEKTHSDADQRPSERNRASNKTALESKAIQTSSRSSARWGRLSADTGFVMTQWQVSSSHSGMIIIWPGISASSPSITSPNSTAPVSSFLEKYCITT